MFTGSATTRPSRTGAGTPTETTSHSQPSASSSAAATISAADIFGPDLTRRRSSSPLSEHLHVRSADVDGEHRRHAGIIAPGGGHPPAIALGRLHRRGGKPAPILLRWCGMTDADLPPALRSILEVLEIRPDDLGLRLHAAELLLENDQPAAALEQCSAVLQRDAGNAEALRLLAVATAALTGSEPHRPARVPAGEAPDASPMHSTGTPRRPTSTASSSPRSSTARRSSTTTTSSRPACALADVGGLDDVKRRLDIAFLTPMRNPELRALYGRSLPGGLLLYGPPGCGKTFLARAVAGELGAGFYAVVARRRARHVDRRERAQRPRAVRDRPAQHAVRALPRRARRARPEALAPALELRDARHRQPAADRDGLGEEQQRRRLRPRRDEPPVGRRHRAACAPGRFDRLLLVAPPDAEARARRSSATTCAAGRSRGSTRRSSRGSTDGFSGADLAHLCDSAAELALEDSVRTGNARPIRMGDFDRAQREVKPSTGPWFEDARNVVMFANEGGRFDDLRDYLNAAPPVVTGNADQALARAESLMELERWRDALRRSRRRSQTTRRRAMAYCMKAGCHLGLGQLDEAEAAARRAAGLAPQEEWPHRLLALAPCCASGKRREAEREAAEAARLEPDSPHALHVLAVSQLGAFRRGRRREARPRLRRSRRTRTRACRTTRWRSSRSPRATRRAPSPPTARRCGIDPARPGADARPRAGATGAGQARRGGRRLPRRRAHRSDEPRGAQGARAGSACPSIGGVGAVRAQARCDPGRAASPSSTSATRASRASSRPPRWRSARGLTLLPARARHARPAGAGTGGTAGRPRRPRARVGVRRRASIAFLLATLGRVRDARATAAARRPRSSSSRSARR